jgi:membrane protease subunit (stomatin/prohibitin family)
MGLISTLGGAIGNVVGAGTQAATSVFADQYLEFFTCDALGQDVLVKRGARKMKNGNNKGDSDVITNGSKIAVPEFTALLLVDNGKITDFTTKAGLYTWDSSSAPSMIGSEGFKEGFMDSLKEIVDRFKAGGIVNSEQRVYFVNMQEISGIQFGTPAPMPYNDPVYRGIYIRMNGFFSFKIVNPVIFFQNSSGNVATEYRKDALIPQIKSEFIGKLTGTLNRCGASGKKIQYNDLPSFQDTDFRDAMQNELDEDWGQARGLEVFKVGINSITPDEKSAARIEKFDSAMLYGQNQAALDAYERTTVADAKLAAGSNANGAGMGGIGLGILQGVDNQTNAAAMQQQFMRQQQAQQAAPVAPVAPAAPAAAAVVLAPAGAWTCSCGAAGNTGKFCAECGQPKPQAPAGWTCSCGAAGNTGKFCMECGKPAPAKGCASCGWAPKNGDPMPKFCPECGKPIV